MVLNYNEELSIDSYEVYFNTFTVLLMDDYVLKHVRHMGEKYWRIFPVLIPSNISIILQLQKNCFRVTFIG